MLYASMLSELHPAKVRELFGEDVERDFDTLQRQFMNDASRLLDFEEAGLFRFWDAHELSSLLRRSGYKPSPVVPCFGSPPQALMISGRRER